MRQVFARTQNVKNFISMMNNLINRPEGVPGMAIVYGEPGLGKSKTALWWAIQNDAVFIRGTNLMTGKWLLEELVEELGDIPQHWTSDLYRQCIKQLTENPRPIIVDEIDYLVNDRKTIETLRDIHDKTNVPIVLVGMGLIDKKLMKHRHLYDRISGKVKFEPLSQKDIKNIFEQLCEVQISDCAIQHIFCRINRFRQLVKLINKAENIASANNLDIIDENIIKEIINSDTENFKAGKETQPV